MAGCWVIGPARSLVRFYRRGPTVPDPRTNTQANCSTIQETPRHPDRDRSGCRVTKRFCYTGDAPEDRFARSLAAVCSPPDGAAWTTGPGPTRALVVHSAKNVAASKKMAA